MHVRKTLYAYISSKIENILLLTIMSMFYMSSLKILYSSTSNNLQSTVKFSLSVAFQSSDL